MPIFIFTVSETVWQNVFSTWSTPRLQRYGDATRVSISLKGQF